MSSSTPSQTAVTSSKWQDSLTTTCNERSLTGPTFQIFSDRRGGRTAWSASVTVGDENGERTFNARCWYSGEFVNNAKEDAAELALKDLGVTAVPTSGTTTPQERST